MKLDKAKAIADDIITRLSPFCKHILIAGSVRREVADVKDIEIVVLPSWRLAAFKKGPTEWVLREQFEKAVKTLGDIKKGKLDGRYVQIHAHQGIMVDLFLPQAFDFWRIFAMRTGSRSYSQNVIARGWNDIGWVGTADGLRLEDQCERRGKAGVWKCIVTDPIKPPSWASEEEFFHWLNVPFIQPRDRDTVKEEDIHPHLDVFQKIEAGYFTPKPDTEVDPSIGLTVGMMIDRLSNYPRDLSVVLHVCENQSPGHLAHEMISLKAATKDGNKDDTHDIVVIACKSGMASLREKYHTFIDGI